MRTSCNSRNIRIIVEVALTQLQLYKWGC